MAAYNDDYVFTEEQLNKMFNDDENENVNGGTSNDATTNVTPVETPVVATPTYSEPPKQTHWYENVFKDENKELDLSEEDRKKLRRRERAERTIAGLGDLGFHIANVWGAAKGGTPITEKPNFSEAYNTKWEKMGLDYDQRKKAYREGLSAARKLDYQQYLADRKQYLAEQKEERIRAEKEYTNALTEAKTYKLYADMAKNSGESEAKINYYNKMAEKAEEQAGYWAARAKMPYAPKSAGGGGGGGKTYNGIPYHNQTEYNALVIQHAQRLGIPTKKNEFGKMVDRNIAEILADIKNAESKGSNSGGNAGGNSGKKPNPMK